MQSRDCVLSESDKKVEKRRKMPLHLSSTVQVEDANDAKFKIEEGRF